MSKDSPKYKIKITEGCTAYGTEINDRPEHELLQSERDEFLDYLMLELRKGIENGTVSLNTVIQNFQYSEFGNEDGYCDQCGDTVGWTIWEI